MEALIADISADMSLRTIKEYEDLKHLRRKIEENILEGRIYA
jgi:hypothetical protein